jgi:hypothetical protein
MRFLKVLLEIAGQLQRLPRWLRGPCGIGTYFAEIVRVCVKESVNATLSGCGSLEVHGSPGNRQVRNMGVGEVRFP